MTDSTAPAVPSATRGEYWIAEEIEQARRLLNDLLMLQGEAMARAGDLDGSDECLALVDLTSFDGPIGTFARRWPS